METATTTPTVNPHSYTLSDDLARLCLPQEYKDSYRGLAWVDSICALFLTIGLIGLNPPQIHVRQLPPLNEVVPVVIQPPEEEQKPEPKQEEKPPETQEVITEQPVVATVVAANPAQVAFAVPVKGPVILAPSAKFAPPPPQNIRPPSDGQILRLNSSDEDWGGKSDKPEYPSLALRRGYQGKVLLEIGFDATGAVVSVTVRNSSGYTMLDDAAIEKVKRDLRLRVPPGEPRVFIKEFTFQLR